MKIFFPRWRRCNWICGMSPPAAEGSCFSDCDNMCPASSSGWGCSVKCQSTLHGAWIDLNENVMKLLFQIFHANIHINKYFQYINCRVNSTVYSFPAHRRYWNEADHVNYLIGWTFFTIYIDQFRNLSNNYLIRLKFDCDKQNFMNLYERKINSVFKVKEIRQ